LSFAPFFVIGVPAAHGSMNTILFSLAIGTMAKVFHDAGTDLRALPMALAQTPAFLYRRPLGSN